MTNAVIVSPYLQAVPHGVADLSRDRLLAVRPAEIRWLEAARLDPEEIARLRGRDPEAFERLLREGLVVDPDEAFRRHAYRNVEIEINRHCNFRCAFCPVETSPKPRGFMTRELFGLVLRRTVEYGAPSVSLHHYSEPTLVPDLVDRIREAAGLGLAVRLHTNASLFDEAKVAALGRVPGVRLVINLPSADPGEYERVTGTKMFDRVMRNLELIREFGIPASLSINSPRESADETVRRINERLAGMFGPSVRWPTDSRAGRLEKPEYAPPRRHEGPLGGCLLALRQINVNHEGRAFLCCQDYDQEYVLGDLREKSLREIAEGERAVQLRKWIFGYERPPAGFLCSRCDWTREAAPLRVGSAKFEEVR